MLTATYTKDFKKIIIRFTNDETEVATMGEVTEQEIEAAVAVGGGLLEGWKSELF